MSLSRILNDEPLPPVPNPSPAPMPAIDLAPRPPLRSRLPTRVDPQPPPPRGHEYQPAAFQGTGRWDPYTGNWVQGEIFPLGRGGGIYIPNEQQGLFPANSRNGYYREEESEELSKKRRRGPEEEGEPKTTGGRRGRVSTPFRFMSFI